MSVVKYILQKTNILGVEVCNTTYDQLVALVSKDINKNKKKTIIAVNPEKYQLAKSNTVINRALRYFDYIIPDGSGIVLASLLTGKGVVRRITGVDLMDKLCELSNIKGYRLFLYGAKPEVLTLAVEKIRKKYPLANIVGYENGYIKEEDEIIESINACKPDIVFVAMGSPKQEEWIFKNKEKINATILQGVGGSFDVLSGDIKRAPLIFRKLSLEWMYRLLKDPSRAKRQFKILGFVRTILYAGLSGEDITIHDSGGENRNRYGKMNVFWFNCFIIIQPLLHISTKYSIYLKTAINIIFLSFLLVVILRNHLLMKAWEKIFALFFLLYFVALMYLHPDILTNFNSLATFIALPLLIYAIFYCRLLILSKYDFKPTKRALIISVLLYGVLMIVAQFSLNTINSYSSSGFGNSGWFYSANDIGTILAVSFPMILYGLVSSRGLLRRLYGFILFLILISAIILGIKTPIISALFTGLIFIMYRLKRSSFSPKKMILIFLLFGTLFGGAIMQMPVYKNMNINKKISEAVIAGKGESILDSKLLNTVLSSRGTYLNDTIHDYPSWSASDKFFGRGYLCSNKGECRIVEMDFFDLFFINGIIGFLLTLGLFIYIMAVAWHMVENKGALPESLFIYALALATLISFLSGHVLFTTPVYLFVVGYIGIIAGQTIKRRQYEN